MHTISRDIKREVPVIDVTLVSIDSQRLSGFWCPYCHNPRPLLQFIGQIVSITEGGPQLGFPIVKRCDNCKRNYCFRGITTVVV